MLPPAPERRNRASEAGYLSLRSVRKCYGTFTAVDSLTIDVAQGEMVAFLGPSGCGKSTSLRMIAGLSEVTSGSIFIAGRDVTQVPTYKRDIGLVFQNYALFPHMKVLQNVMFGLLMRGMDKAQARRRAMEAIEQVQLSGRENHRPAELSGGQQQRVALARALVTEPAVLLFDEPLSNLDAKLRDEMRSEIRNIQKSLGITSIFVTHDQTEALSMCDRVAVLNEGRLEQIGTPYELYEAPRTPFVASFVGRSNTLSGDAHGAQLHLGAKTLTLSRSHHGRVSIMVRPHRIRLHPAGTAPEPTGQLNQVAGRIVQSFYAGDVLQYEVDTDIGRLSVETSTHGAFVPHPAGSAVMLEWAVADTLVHEHAT